MLILLLLLLLLLMLMLLLLLTVLTGFELVLESVPLSAEKMRREPYRVPHKINLLCMAMQVTSSLEFKPGGS